GRLTSGAQAAASGSGCNGRSDDILAIVFSGRVSWQASRTLRVTNRAARENYRVSVESDDIGFERDRGLLRPQRLWWWAKGKAHLGGTDSHRKLPLGQRVQLPAMSVPYSSVPTPTVPAPHFRLHS